MQPKIIVHIGSGKAGSTSLQKGLALNSDRLSGQGVWVVSKDGRPLNQTETTEVFSRSRSDPASVEFLDDLRRTQEERAFRYIIFSSEYLISKDLFAENIRDLLRDISSDVRVVLYFREPSERYRSGIQQVLKATDVFPDPRTWRADYKRTVELWYAVYGDSLFVVPFQKSEIGPDITADFLKRFAGFSDSDTLAAQDPRNVSEYAEVSYLMQKYFRRCYAGEPRRFRAEADRLRQRLQKAAIACGSCTKANLKPDVKNEILTNHSEELIWLSDVKGVTFDSLDYARFGAASPKKKLKFSGDVSDVLEVDEAAAETILMQSIRDLSEENQALTEKIRAIRSRKKDVPHSRFKTFLRSLKRMARMSAGRTDRSKSL